MTPSVANSQFHIFDDVLSSADFQRFWEMFRNTEFELAHAKRKADFYRMSDGNPFVGDNVAWIPGGAAQLLPSDLRLESLPVRLFPIGNPLDALIEALREHVLPSCSELIGRAGERWIATVGQLYAYPAGSGLSWHVDDDELAGSFIYYASPKWDVQWGGELFIADETTRHQLPRQSIHDFGNTRDSEVLLQQGMGHFIMPKPNRLVVIGPGNPHKVAKIAPAAGDHVRASFSGFFIARDGLEKLLSAKRAQKGWKE